MYLVVLRYLKSGSFYWCYENNLCEHDVTLWYCRSTLARVTSPRIRGLHHVDTLPEFAVDRDISGAMTIAIKNISKSKFNSLDNTESATRKIESIKRIRTNCKNVSTCVFGNISKMNKRISRNVTNRAISSLFNFVLVSAI